MDISHNVNVEISQLLLCSLKVIMKGLSVDNKLLVIKLSSERSFIFL